jgi:hypothetical protein
MTTAYCFTFKEVVHSAAKWARSGYDPNVGFGARGNKHLYCNSISKLIYYISNVFMLPSRQMLFAHVLLWKWRSKRNTAVVIQYHFNSNTSVLSRPRSQCVFAHRRVRPSVPEHACTATQTGHLSWNTLCWKHFFFRHTCLPSYTLTKWLVNFFHSSRANTERKKVRTFFPLSNSYSWVVTKCSAMKLERT